MLLADAGEISDRESEEYDGARDPVAAVYRQILHTLKGITRDSGGVEQMTVSVGDEISRSEQADGQPDPRQERKNESRRPLQSAHIRSGGRIRIARIDDIDSHRAERIMGLVKHRADQRQRGESHRNAEYPGMGMASRALEGGNVNFPKLTVGRQEDEQNHHGRQRQHVENIHHIAERPPELAVKIKSKLVPPGGPCLPVCHLPSPSGSSIPSLQYFAKILSQAFFSRSPKARK
ncbi:MAG: hypothetical protein WA652_07345 [Xanthobacteraceae bacterium]